jgi:chaperonin GroEL
VVNKLRGGLGSAVRRRGSATAQGDARGYRRVERRRGLSEELGTLENVTLEMLGRAKKVRIEGEHDVIDGGGKKDEIAARVARSGADRSHIRLRQGEKLQERLAKLAGGVAVIRVGGGSEVGSRSARIASMTRCTRRRLRWRKGLLPAAAWHCSLPSGHSTV